MQLFVGRIGPGHGLNLEVNGPRREGSQDIAVDVVCDHAIIAGMRWDGSGSRGAL